MGEGDVGSTFFIGRAIQISVFCFPPPEYFLQRLLRAFLLSIVGALALRGAPRHLGATRILFPGSQEVRFVWQGPRISMVSTQIFGNDYSDFR